MGVGYVLKRAATFFIAEGRFRSTSGQVLCDAKTALRRLGYSQRCEWTLAKDGQIIHGRGWATFNPKSEVRYTSPRDRQLAQNLVNELGRRGSQVQGPVLAGSATTTRHVRRCFP